jgi:DNA-binding transcriptional ArsR family regulator
VDSQTRRQSLLELLENAETPLNVTALSESLAVSPRTIHNDLDALKESGLTIQTLMGRGGGIWLEQSTEPDQQHAEASDAIGEQPNSHSIPKATRFAHQPVFVGRAQENSRLKLALEQILTSAGRLILLSGESGTGKSRLCQQITEQAAD